MSTTHYYNGGVRFYQIVSFLFSMLNVKFNFPIGLGRGTRENVCTRMLNRI